MALFQRKPTIESSVPLYTFSAQKTVLIIGLGNPSEEYDYTRHNIGFLCVDIFAKDNNFDPWILKKDLKSEMTQATMGQTRVILAKPQTFMNKSGEAVQAIMHFYKISPQDVLVIHDELDIQFGQIRCRMGGGAAGHNGIKSLIQHIGGDFGRIRIGIGPKTHETMDSADFVLQRFSDEERNKLKNLSREVTAILTETIYGGDLPHETRSF